MIRVSSSMRQFAITTIVFVVCLAAGIVGAVIGTYIELSWPLSVPNQVYTLQCGLTVGLLGSVITAWFRQASKGRSNYSSIVLGGLATATLSGATMWLKVVSSFG
jgi:uncharacterized membrane protein YeaQ/YmgE (transglycosylase-associated protein family)